MIYTEVVYTIEEWETVNVLYIVDPKTENFVAAEVIKWDINTNYQFQY